jgi:hypothetical protein
MEDLDLAIIIFMANIVAALIAVAWCNKKIKNITDKDKK